MTKDERVKLRVAIEEIGPGGNYIKGINILYLLAGYGEHPTVTLQRNGKLVPVGDIPRTPETK